MLVNSFPKPYEEWRTEPVDRSEDAAYTFGYHLIVHCRDEAINSLPKGVTPEMRAVVEKAVDTALNSVTDMLEGFWKLDAGPKHIIELVLSVRVNDHNGQEIESVEISPNPLDLSIGYWKWAKDREFR